MPGVKSELPARLIREHRDLDELFGRFLVASSAGDSEAALRAIRAFDEALRRHTAFEEENAILAPEGRRLVPNHAHDAEHALARELRLEHVQVREVSAMILRLLEEKSDLEGARRLAPNLARRWDAHTTREERELFGTPPG
jgi:hypothetical protein